MIWHDDMGPNLEVQFPCGMDESSQKYLATTCNLKYSNPPVGTKCESVTMTGSTEYLLGLREFHLKSLPESGDN